MASSRYERGELLIALVKDGATDEICAASVHPEILRQLGKSLEEIVGRKSSETWPDFNGYRYRHDDQLVLCGENRMAIFEQITVANDDIFVLTDKFSIRGHGSLILVVVHRLKELGLAYSEGGYFVAIVSDEKLLDGFRPNHEAEIPGNGQLALDVENCPCASGPDGVSCMDFETACALRDEANARIIRKEAAITEWHIVFPTSYTSDRRA